MVRFPPCVKAFYRFSLAATDYTTIAANILPTKYAINERLIDAVNDAPNIKNQWFDDISFVFITFRYFFLSSICCFWLPFYEWLLCYASFIALVVSASELTFVCASFMCHLCPVITIYFRKLYSSWKNEEKKLLLRAMPVHSVSSLHCTSNARNSIDFSSLIIGDSLVKSMCKRQQWETGRERERRRPP